RCAPPARRSALTALTRGGSRSGLHVGHDVLDAGVLLEAVHRQVLAMAGLLETAVRHLRDEWDVAVDPHAAEVQSTAHPHRPTEVLRPHTRGETVVDAIGPRRGLVLVRELLHRDHRA